MKADVERPGEISAFRPANRAIFSSVHAGNVFLAFGGRRFADHAPCFAEDQDRESLSTKSSSFVFSDV